MEETLALCVDAKVAALEKNDRGLLAFLKLADYPSDTIDGFYVSNNKQLSLGEVLQAVVVCLKDNEGVYPYCLYGVKTSEGVFFDIERDEKTTFYYTPGSEEDFSGARSLLYKN